MLFATRALAVLAVTVPSAIFAPVLTTSGPVAPPQRPIANPAHNAPEGNLAGCLVGPASAGPLWLTAPCLRSQLALIDKARASEGLGPMVLPGWYPKLTVPEQLLTVTDLEREARGLPIFVGLSASLDAMARKGALAGVDPVGPALGTWGSNWMGGAPTALLADFGWVYADGPDSGNIDCVPGNMSGCWGHRDNILDNYGPHPFMGAAAARYNGTTSMTELFATWAPGSLAWRLPGRF